MKYILALLFGQKAKDKSVPKPTSLPPERSYTTEDYNNWMIEFKVGSKYGHRGSFYQNR